MIHKNQEVHKPQLLKEKKRPLLEKYSQLSKEIESRSLREDFKHLPWNVIN